MCFPSFSIMARMAVLILNRFLISVYFSELKITTHSDGFGLHSTQLNGNVALILILSLFTRDTSLILAILLYNFKEVRNTDDLNPLEGNKIKKMFISGHNYFRAGPLSAFQNPVVLFIRQLVQLVSNTVKLNLVSFNEFSHFPGIKDFCLTTRHVLHIACDDDKTVDIGGNGDQAVDHWQFLASLLRLAQQRSPGPGNFRVDLHKPLSESQRK